jgi:hypothetical protein
VLHSHNLDVVLIVLDCWQMHADDFRLDRYGVVSGLRDGGYSDDMTLAAIAGNESISNFIVFPGKLLAGLEAFIYTDHNFVLLSAVKITC